MNTRMKSLLQFRIVKQSGLELVDFIDNMTKKDHENFKNISYRGHNAKHTIPKYRRIPVKGKTKTQGDCT